MKTVIHISQTEACELLAGALQRLNNGSTVYKVTAVISPGYSGNALDHSPASVRFEAAAVMEKPSESV